MKLAKLKIHGDDVDESDDNDDYDVNKNTNFAFEI
jgi:hypothetical protein